MDLGFSRCRIVVVSRRCRTRSKLDAAPKRGVREAVAHEKIEDICDDDTSATSRVILPSASLSATAQSHFFPLPHNVTEIRFVRLILKRNGFAFCALFLCTFKKPIHFEEIVT
jgi:hypothetical protein